MKQDNLKQRQRRIPALAWASILLVCALTVNLTGYTRKSTHAGYYGTEIIINGDFESITFVCNDIDEWYGSAPDSGDVSVRIEGNFEEYPSRYIGLTCAQWRDVGSSFTIDLSHCSIVDNPSVYRDIRELLIVGETYLVTLWIQQGKTAMSVESASKEYGVLLVSPLPPDPEREHYVFTGWYLDEDCTIPYDDRPVTADLDLYAGWRLKQYTVTFISAYAQRADEQVDALTPRRFADLSYAGYRFLGWFYDAEYTVPYIDFTEITGDLTLYAKWEVRTFTVRFFVDGAIYKEFAVQYGTRLTDIAQEIKAATYSNVILYGVTSDMTVTGDMDIEGDLIMTNNGKIITHFQDNWLIYLFAGIGVVLAAAAVVAIAATTKSGGKKHGKKKKRS